MSARITISLVEDHDDTREVWRRCLAREPDFAMLDEFADAESALARLSARLPTVVLVDWHLGEGRMDGIEFIRQIKSLFPELLCLLITAYDLEHLPAEAFRSGADGFVFKSDPLRALPQRIRAALAGEFPLSARAAKYLVTSLRAEGAAASAALQKLTRREREVLLRVGAGDLEKEVAASFGRSVNTVRNQLASAYGKLGVHKLPEALNKLRGGGGRKW